MAKIKTLKDLVGYHEHFTATVGAVGAKIGQHQQLVVCLNNIKYRGEIIADHVWVQRVEVFAGIKKGSDIKFRASVRKIGYGNKVGFGTPQQIRKEMK